MRCIEDGCRFTVCAACASAIYIDDGVAFGNERPTCLMQFTDPAVGVPKLYKFVVGEKESDSDNVDASVAKASSENSVNNVSAIRDIDITEIAIGPRQNSSAADPSFPQLRQQSSSTNPNILRITAPLVPTPPPLPPPRLTDYEPLVLRSDTDNSATSAASDETTASASSEPRTIVRQISRVTPAGPPTLYRVVISERLGLELKFDRTLLNSLMDRRQDAVFLFWVFVIAFFTAFLGCRVSPFYTDISVVALWFTVACSLFSLLKAVQSDASSSIIDDHQIAFSRGFYFCCLSILVLIFDAASRHAVESEIVFYGVLVNSKYLLHIVLQVFLWIILLLPAIFLFGHLPRLSTLAHYLLEQIEIHGFGGLGTHDLQSAVFVVVRNATIGSLLWLISWAALSLKSNTIDSARNPVFSLFVGLIVAVGYFFSRLPSDVSILLDFLPVRIQDIISPRPAV